VKTRIGFVSNSSSSSFCIYGIYLGHMSDEDYEFINKTGLTDYGSPLDGDTYVGRSWTSIGNNETGGQFKESVEKLIANRWPDKKCNTYEEAWYDG
jgi:hypothetical protein